MNHRFLFQKIKWPIGLILLWFTHGVGWCQEGPFEDDPLRKMEIWSHGIYENPAKAEKMITPEFLRRFDVKDRYFMDALRMYVGTDMLRTMSIDPGQLPSVGRIITDEIKRRGDEIVPAFIALMQEPRNPYCPLANQILIYLPSIENMDMVSFLSYVRSYLHDNPNEMETRENSADYGAMTSFIGKFGSEEDLPLIERRESSSQHVIWMKERLAKEKVTGVKNLEPWRRAREATGPSQNRVPATKTKEPGSGPEAIPVPPSMNWLWALLLTVGIAIGMAIWRGLNGKSS